jgi:hypothetical protein
MEDLQRRWSLHSLISVEFPVDFSQQRTKCRKLRTAPSQSRDGGVASAVSGIASIQSPWWLDC